MIMLIRALKCNSNWFLSAEEISVIKEGSEQVQHKSSFAAIENGLSSWIMIEEGQYYLCGENKEADQLRSYCAADLHLCFCICKKLVFLLRGSFKSL